MDKKDRLLRLIEYFSRGNKSEFARMIGISPQAVNTWLSRNTFDVDTVYSKCINISAEWLLSGNGPMLKPAAQGRQMIARENTISTTEKPPEAFRCVDPQHPVQDAIPLVTPKVAAGFGTADFAIVESDVKEFYVIPKWRRQHVDFMIEVTGDSMQPKYNAGDIVGCTIIHNSSFIQWNRPHVIATREQGLLVKRVMPGSTAKTISAVSDNPKYPPFDIPKNEITGIALVIGMVGLE